MPKDRIVWLTPASTTLARRSAPFNIAAAENVAAMAEAMGEETVTAADMAVMEMVRHGVPAHDPPLAARDEAIFLLRTAAEVEHALLVQYLYAAYSLKRRGDGLTDEQQSLVNGWRTTLIRIAKEEMGHLMTVQNLLLLIDGPLNFEREHFPFLSDFYPFHFRLEPLTKESLAKYVLAEKPEGPLPDPASPELLEELIDRAGADNQQLPVNRVGALYAALYCIFSTGDEGPADRWFDCKLLKATDDGPGCVAPTPLPKHLADSDFISDSGLPAQQGQEDTWGQGGEGSFPHVLVPAATNRKEARDAIRAVAEQGEGAGAGKDSHFSRFLTVFQAFPETDARRGPVTWTATRTVPANPNTLRCPTADVARGTIVNAGSRAIAELFNLRYCMLLSCLSHFLQLNRDPASSKVQEKADFLSDTSLHGLMRDLTRISDLLTGLAQWNEAEPARAAPPFELPYTTDLPAREIDRWRWHMNLRQLSLAAIEALRKSQPPPSPQVEEVLIELKSADEDAIQQITELGSGAIPNPPPTPSPTPPPAPEPTTSFASDIRPLFRDIDVQHMKDVSGLDLQDYQQVRDNSGEILNRVKSTGPRRMPPPPDAPWTTAEVDLFQKWIDESFPQ